jgi:hypothetical protein
MTTTLTETEGLKAVISEAEHELGVVMAKLEDEWADEAEKPGLIAQQATLQNRIMVAKKELGSLVKEKSTKEKMSEVTPPTEPLARYEFDKAHKRVCTKVQVDLVQEWGKLNGFKPFIINEPYSYEQIDAYLVEAKRNLEARSEPAKDQDEYEARLAELREAIVIKERFVPETQEDFDWVVNKMLAAQDELDRRQKQFEEDKKILERQMDNLNFLYEKPLEEFCIEQCKKTGKKTVKFSAGKVSFTKQNAGYILDPEDRNKLLIASEFGVMGAETKAALKVEAYTSYRYEDLNLIKEWAAKNKKDFKGLKWKEEVEFASMKVKA